MSDPFDSPRALLARARTHLSEYAYKHGQYSNKRPFQHLIQRNPVTGEEVRKVRVNGGYPAELGVIAFDAINCLRSAMDHAVFAATSMLTAGLPDAKRVKFPVSDTRERVVFELTHKNGKASQVPHELHDILLGFRAHKDEGGNETLWGFNSIRNENIHRVLSPVAAASSSVSIGGNGHIGKLDMVDEWDPARGELTYAKGRNIGRGIQIEITIQISFTESSGLPLRPVLGTLNSLANTTQGIITTLESETARILSERPT